MPKGFLWGTAIAGFQSEMGGGRSTDPTSDWWAWVHDKGNIASGTVSGEMPENGPGFWLKYEADIKLARRELGANLFRMGLEWSRLFPTQPTNLPARAATSIAMLRALDRQADPKAVRGYREILKSIRANKMSPFVTLNHFTLPGWIHDPLAVHAALAGRDPNAALPPMERAGWLDSATVTEFERYCAWAAWRFGDLVDRWAPINEPMVVTTNGFVNIPGVFSGSFPPGVYSFTAAIAAIGNLEAAVLDGLSNRLMDPDLFKVFCEEFHREVNRLRMDDNAELIAQKADLEKVERRIHKIVEMITDDDAPIRALKDELRALEARRTQLEAAKAKAKAPQPLLHPNLAELYRRKVSQLQAALQYPKDREEAFELIRGLIDQIVLTPAKGQLEIEIKGQLAAILELCDGARKAKPGTVSGAGLAEQLKMVAGVGFEPTTFRL